MEPSQDSTEGERGSPSKSTTNSDENNVADVGLGTLTSPRRFRRPRAASRRSPSLTPGVSLSPISSDGGNDRPHHLTEHTNPLLSRWGLQAMIENSTISDQSLPLNHRPLPALFVGQTPDEPHEVDGRDGWQEHDGRGNGGDQSMKKLMTLYENALVEKEKLLIGKRETEKQMSLVEARYEAQNTYLKKVQKSLDESKKSAQSWQQEALEMKNYKKDADTALERSQEQVNALEKENTKLSDAVSNHAEQERHSQATIKKIQERERQIYADKRRGLEQELELSRESETRLQDALHDRQTECKRLYGEVERCHAWMGKIFEEQTRRDDAELRLYDARLPQLLKNRRSVTIRDSLPPSYEQRPLSQRFASELNASPTLSSAEMSSVTQELPQSSDTAAVGRPQATTIASFDDVRAIMPEPEAMDPGHNVSSHRLPELASSEHNTPKSAGRGYFLSRHRSEKLESPICSPRQSLVIDLPELLAKGSLSGRALSLPLSSQQHAELQSFMDFVFKLPVSGDVFKPITAGADITNSVAESTEDRPDNTSLVADLDAEGEPPGRHDANLQSDDRGELEGDIPKRLPRIITESDLIAGHTENMTSQRATETVKEASATSSGIEYPPSPGLRKRNAVFPKESPLVVIDSPAEKGELENNTDSVTDADHENECSRALAEAVRRLAAYDIHVVNTTEIIDQLGKFSTKSDALLGRIRSVSHPILTANSKWAAPILGTPVRRRTRHDGHSALTPEYHFAGQNDPTRSSSDGTSDLNMSSDSPGRAGEDTMDTQYSDESGRPDTPLKDQVLVQLQSPASALVSTTTVGDSSSPSEDDVQGLTTAKMHLGNQARSSNPLISLDDGATEDAGDLEPASFHPHHRVPIHQRRSGNLAEPNLVISHDPARSGPSSAGSTTSTPRGNGETGNDFRDPSKPISFNPKQAAAELPDAFKKIRSKTAAQAPQWDTESKLERHVFRLPKANRKNPSYSKRDNEVPLDSVHERRPVWLILPCILLILGTLLGYWVTSSLVPGPRVSIRSCPPCPMSLPPAPEADPYHQGWSRMTITISLASTHKHTKTSTETYEKVATQFHTTTAIHTHTMISTKTQTRTVYTAAARPPREKDTKHSPSSDPSRDDDGSKQNRQQREEEHQRQRSLLNSTSPLSFSSHHHQAPTRDFQRAYAGPGRWGLLPEIQHFIDTRIFDFAVWSSGPALGQKSY